MSEELEFPTEGLGTIGAMFTSTTVKRIVETVRRMRMKGMTEQKIVAKMRKELHHFDEHSIQRIYDKAADRPTADDITATNVIKETPIKPGTVQLEVQDLVFGVGVTGLIQYQGKDWYVAGIKGKTYTLKHIL